MTAALRQPFPAGEVANIVRFPGSRRGRPRGAVGPLAMWLGPQIRKFRAQGANCTNVFRSLSVVEGGDAESFCVSPETADAYERDLGVDLTGMTVTLVNFKKIWQRA